MLREDYADEDFAALVERVEGGDEEAAEELMDVYAGMSHAGDCPYRIKGECLCERGEMALVLTDAGHAV